MTETPAAPWVYVSPTSIRSRILKVHGTATIVDPVVSQSFTHVDPFEDTERLRAARVRFPSMLKVSPTSIRSRILKVVYRCASVHAPGSFHPRRSVRGY